MTASNHLHLPWQEPMAVARILADVFGEDGLVWLDGDGGALGHEMTMAAAPVETICCRGLPGESGARNPFEALRQLTDGHWCGWLSYEAAACLNCLQPLTAIPEVCRRLPEPRAQ